MCKHFHFLHDRLLERGLKSFASVPLALGERVTAVLHCSFLSQRRSFGEHEQALLKAFSANAAVVLDQARRQERNDQWLEFDREIAACKDVKTIGRLFAVHARSDYYADFAVFYSYDPTAPFDHRLALKDCIIEGDLDMEWVSPSGGLHGGIYEALVHTPDGVLVVNDVDQPDCKFRSHLASREQIKAFIGMRLEVIPEGSAQPHLAGMLFVNFRQPTYIQSTDLKDLRLAGNYVAAAMLRLHLLSALQKEGTRRERQLKAVGEIIQNFLRPGDRGALLESIATTATQTMDVDACTVVEYNKDEGEFCQRGTSGLNLPDAGFTVTNDLQKWFLDQDAPTVISDVTQHPRMRISGFVQREQIMSVVVFPLRFENQDLGLLFANYRYRKNPAQDEITALRMFADFTSIVLHEARLRGELVTTQNRLVRRRFLTSVSMLEDTWRHSLVQKATAILNYAAILRKQFTRIPSMSGAEALMAHLLEIDRLAREIAAAPPRVPHTWEQDPEFIPLAPLIDEIAQREGRHSYLERDSLAPIEIHSRLTELSGVQVKGYRRWLIFVVEALLQNARHAMPEGGKITIYGRIDGRWAEVRITDTGSGVPEAVQARLFRDPIPQAQDDVGMGIGGLLVATIIEEQGGTIELEKPGPSDTTVLIRIPILTEIPLT